MAVAETLPMLSALGGCDGKIEWRYCVFLEADGQWFGCFINHRLSASLFRTGIKQVYTKESGSDSGILRFIGMCIGKRRLVAISMPFLRE